MRLLAALAGLLLALAGPVAAQSLEELVAKLPAGDYSDRAAVVSAIGATGDPRAAALLGALNEGDLQQRKSDGVVIIVTGRGSDAKATDALTGADLGPVAPRSTNPVKVNNLLRRAVRSAIATLSLVDADPAKRLSSAEQAFAAPDPEAISALDTAIAKEQDARVKTALVEARAAAVLASDGAPRRQGRRGRPRRRPWRHRRP